MEKTFEKAFQQEILFLSDRAPKYPILGERLKNLIRNHDKMKNEVMTKLGFSDPRTEKVGITPKCQELHYLFNTKVMKPPLTAAIIRSHM